MPRPLDPASPMQADVEKRLAELEARLIDRFSASDATMREMMEAASGRVSVLEVKLAERYDGQDRALQAAIAANDKRLDSMNEFRNSLLEQNSRMITRMEAMAQIQALESKTSSELSAIREKTDTIGKPNYVLGVSTISTLLALVAGLWVVLGLKIDTSTAPLSLLLEQVKATEMEHERSITTLQDQMRGQQTSIAEAQSHTAQSRSDRVQLNDRVRQIEVMIPQLSAERRGQIADLTDKITRLNVWMEFIHEKIFSGRQSGVRKPP